MNKNIIKIILIGDTNVGKTCLVKRYLQNQYSGTENTIGLEYATRDIMIESEVVNVQIWDTAGQERFQSLVETYFTGTDGAIIVFDICSEDSFNHVPLWIDKLQKKCTESPAIILVGNKLDLESKRKVSKEDVYAFAQKEQIDYYDTSAKTGENVQDVFYQIEHQAFRLFKEKRSKNVENKPIVRNDTQQKNCFC